MDPGEGLQGRAEVEPSGAGLGRERDAAGFVVAEDQRALLDHLGPQFQRGAVELHEVDRRAGQGGQVGLQRAELPERRLAGLIVPALVGRGIEVRVMVHDPPSGTCRAQGAREVVQGDLADRANLYERWQLLYSGDMVIMNISAARENLPHAVETARTEAVFVERYGRPAAVLVSPERYEELLAAFENAQDVAAFDAALEEEGPNIPWDQVKADLGWT